MIINHNLNSMNAHRNMSFNTAQTGKAMEKLSSGLRINRAGDDAAGLAISEKMRGQIRGLDQATRNSQDGISLIQTAEGALNETHSILQRMRELAVQSSNDTNTDSDRGEIQKELDQLVSEIDRIGNNTEFNTKKLLNGGAGLQGNVSGTDKAVILGGSENVKIGTVNIADMTASSAGTLRFESRVTADGSDAAFSGFAAGTFSINGTSISVSSSDTVATFTEKVNTVSSSTGVTVSGDLSNGFTFTTEGTGSQAKIDVSGFNNVVTVGASNELQSSVNGGSLADSTGTQSMTGRDASITISSASVGTTVPTGYTASGNVVTFSGGDYDGLSIKVDKSASDVDGVGINVTANNVLSMHIGANESQTMQVGVNDMRARALGVNSIDVSSKSGSENAITTIDDAIASVSAERSKLGAYQNRLEHTINNLSVGAENLQASESRIRDVDMAKEMMNFTKNNILNQAAQAMMSQSNQQPQAVLQLLR